MLDINIPCEFHSREIAQLSARLVYKNLIIRKCTDFYEQMDAVNDDCSNFAIKLFTGDALLKPKWISDPSWKGLGRWTSQELDSTDFFVIESIHADTNHRDKGIGKEMMNVLLDWGLRSGVQIAFLWPAKLSTAEADRARSITFCRSVGFGRVGTSDWFAYSTVCGPPTWSAEEDFDPEEGAEG